MDLFSTLPDANAVVRHPADAGSWVWHPARGRGETAFLRFRLDLEVGEDCAPLVHLSADQRFQFRLDGILLSCGPDRCDLDNWSVHSFPLALSAGSHQLEVLAWWMAEPAPVGRSDIDVQEPGPPMAQMSWQPGFLLYSEDAPPSLLNTGSAPWQVDDLTPHVSLKRPHILGYYDVGPEFTFQLSSWGENESVSPVVVLGPVRPNQTGVRRPGRCLAPSPMPEQERFRLNAGRIRIVRDGWGEESFAEGPESEGCAAYQALLDEGSPVEIAPGQAITLLWDFEDYRCGYPEFAYEGGEGSLIEIQWAESLYHASHSAGINGKSSKGNRAEVDGKAFLGYGDRWLLGREEPPPAFWWRSGRYLRVRIRTGGEALALKRLSILSTGYPFGAGSHWRSSRPDWDRLIPLFENSYRAGGHDTWTDCPYYEQMCYVGDTRLHCLATYGWFEDDRLNRRAVDLFSSSSRGSGLVAERYPSSWRQECPTYSLLWPLMVADFADWRDDPEWIRNLLPALRSVFAVHESYLRDNHLLAPLPGWPFVDWVPAWELGCGPGVREGDSSIVNLHFVLSARATAAVERAYGDPALAERCECLARSTFEAVIEHYWSEERSLLLDSGDSDAASEHAQTFALLCGLLDSDRERACLAALTDPSATSAKATIYFSFYVLEVLYRFGEAADFHRRLGFWTALPDQGFTATPEAPEPSRSDAHAWGSHPLWHSYASIAGIRPAAPGFRRVRVAPLPGEFQFIETAVVHPAGRIRLHLDFRGPRPTGVIELPQGVDGEFSWQGESLALRPGENRINP